MRGSVHLSVVVSRWTTRTRLATATQVYRINCPRTSSTGIVYHHPVNHCQRSIRCKNVANLTETGRPPKCRRTKLRQEKGILHPLTIPEAIVNVAAFSLAYSKYWHDLCHPLNQHRRSILCKNVNRRQLLAEMGRSPKCRRTKLRHETWIPRNEHIAHVAAFSQAYSKYRRDLCRDYHCKS